MEAPVEPISCIIKFGLSFEGIKCTCAVGGVEWGAPFQELGESMVLEMECG